MAGNIDYVRYLCMQKVNFSAIKVKQEVYIYNFLVSMTCAPSEDTDQAYASM